MSRLKQRKPLQRKGWIRSTQPKGKTKSLAMRVAEACGTAVLHKPKPPSVYRSKPHRKNVASLPCASCGARNRSQAAHLNFVELGKGMSIKLSDALCVPLCADNVGRRGCHSLLDQGGVYDNRTAKALQMMWLQETRTRMKRMGLWPEEAEIDVVKFVGAYLRRQVGSDERCSAPAATDPSGDQI